MSAELTYQDVAEHNTKKDIYVVVHDKIYDVTKFVDEHPGGEEVMMDVAGQDATEAFEDIGHSDEAREILDDLIVGSLKRAEGDPVPASSPAANASMRQSKADQTGLGLGVYAVIVIGGVLGYFGYTYFQAQQQQK